MIKAKFGTESRGFTLVELLVVISIIALLLSILMPSLGKARKIAKATVCMSNLKQWGLAFGIYTQDNNGRFPLYTYPLPDGFWMESLRSIYGNIDKMRVCPEATALSPRKADGWGGTFKAWRFNRVWYPWMKETDFGSYGANGWIRSGWLQSNGAITHDTFGWETTSAKKANEIPLILDAKWTNFWPDVTYAKNTLPRSGDNEIDGMRYNDWTLGGYCIDRHSGSVNSCFVDLSAKKVPLPELWHLRWSKQWTPETWPEKVTLPWLKK